MLKQLNHRQKKYTCVNHQNKIYNSKGRCEICRRPLSFVVEYTPVFDENKKAFEAGYPGIANEGSSRSSKTYSEMQLISLIGLQPETYGKLQISVVSHSLPHLKKGARKDFLEIADDWGFFKEDDFNRTDNIYTFKGGTQIEFFSADDATKVRGPGRDILVITEANLVSFAVYEQLAMRTTGVIFLDYNPADEQCWVYDFADDPENKMIHSTYLNNLNNLSKKQIHFIEKLTGNSRKVFALGLRGTSEHTIYTHHKIIDHFPACDEVVYGLDFGFNHANALIKVGMLDDDIYLEEMLYEVGQLPEELGYAIQVLGLNGTHEIYADHSRPDTIEHLNRIGLWVQSADKSVWDGIQFLKSKKLYITRNSLNLINEFKTYKWKVDKEGNRLEEPVKRLDDACDAARYGAYTKFNTPQITYAGATY